VIFNLNYILI